MLIVRPKIPQMPQNLYAQTVCFSPKLLDFNEERLHWVTVVRGLNENFKNFKDLISIDPSSYNHNSSSSSSRGFLHWFTVSTKWKWSSRLQCQESCCAKCPYFISRTATTLLFIHNTAKSWGEILFYIAILLLSIHILMFKVLQFSYMFWVCWFTRLFANDITNYRS